MIRAHKRVGRSRINMGRQRGHSYTMPAPVKGWNARDSLAAMKEDEASILDNWFPEQTYVRVRNGDADHTPARVYLQTEAGDDIITEDSEKIVYTHGIDGDVESLMEWSGPAADKMFAAVNGEIQNVTTSGEPPVPDYQSLTNDRWQSVMFGNSAGNFLYMVNGADAPRYYDGTSFTIPTITGTGLTATNLIHVNVFKRRVFFIENQKPWFWYFPVETVSGAIAKFDLAPLMRLGGALMAMGTWTIDGGQGPDDLAVFISTKGDAIVFQGTDPGDADNWSHVGTFTLAHPIGRRCVLQFGGELVLLTEDGLVPLSMFLPTSRARKDKAMTDMISGAFGTAHDSYEDTFGWQPIFHPDGDMIILNVPQSGDNVQFVQNATTKAWCRFTGWDAFCFGIMDNELYYGTTDAVRKGDTGNQDSGGNISGDVRTAFSYFRQPVQQKNLKLARPILETDGTPSIVMSANIDFELLEPTGTPTFTTGGGSEWDVAEWDVAAWAGEDSIKKDWQSIDGVGYAIALRFKTASQGTLRWLATDFIYERGGLV